MGNCCSNEDARVEELGNKPVQPNEQIYQDPVHINYGPLRRDEESLPNTVQFGQAVQLYDGDYLVPTGSQVRMSQSNLKASQFAINNQQDPLEKSFRAAISSPEKTNRIRIVQQQEQGNYLTEPLAEEQKDTRCMELNKNMKTPQLSNSIYKGGSSLNTQEQPFYNQAGGQSNQLNRLKPTPSQQYLLQSQFAAASQSNYYQPTSSSPPRSAPRYYTENPTYNVY